MTQTSTVNSYTHNTELLKQLSEYYGYMGHRQIILVSGKLEWSWGLVDAYLKDKKQVTLITDKTSDLQSIITDQEITISTARPDKPSTLLGFNCSNAIIDCSEGFYPDALTSISGAIQPGGFLFVLCPTLDQWPLSKDAFAKKRTSYGQCETPTSPNTIKRFIDHCKQGNALLIEQTDPEQPTDETHSKSQALLLTPQQRLAQLNKPVKNPLIQDDEPWSLPNHSNQQQTDISNWVKQHLLTGDRLTHKTQPLPHEHADKQFHIIQADRGRGKSHLLGLIADFILDTTIDNGIKCYITAPNKTATQSVFRSTQHLNNSHSLEFVAPERVLDTVKPQDILLVDEAASLPLPILMAWSLAFKTLIFATTTHGYEGTGKGFQIRFLNHLKQLTNNIHQHRLEQPIRYAQNDPLENIMFKSFCLNSEPDGLVLPTDSVKTLDIRPASEAVTCKEISQSELIAKSSLLNNLFALLVQAHYQTRPSDLRDILDSPSIRIFALFNTINHTDYLVCACLISIEGDFSNKDDGLIKNIVNGSRRPKGHLIPQVLTLHMGQVNALKLKGGRIIRIATLPNLQNHSYGSQLLTYTTKILKQEGYDYIGSSYADTPDVNSFWNKNGFSIVRTGNKLDKSSGTKSKLVLNGLSDKGEKLVDSCAEFYKHQSDTFQTYADLNDRDKQLITIFINETGSYEAVKDILERCVSWQTFFNKQFPKKASLEFREIVSAWTTRIS